MCVFVSEMPPKPLRLILLRNAHTVAEPCPLNTLDKVQALKAQAFQKKEDFLLFFDVLLRTA
ncbi:hypothetical protein I925_04955 [Streptococcus sanguinis OH0843]|nr:hypothetical protein I925_04955 [Streptococcus sanguinis OH0843]